MLAGVGTGLEPRASIGPFASDVGLKKTHLLVDPGLSLGHLPWSLARLLLEELAITSSLGLLTSKGWSFSSAEISAQRASFLCLLWKRPCSLSYSSGCSFTNSTMTCSWLSVNVAQTLALFAAKWHSHSSSHLFSSLQASSVTSNLSPVSYIFSSISSVLSSVLSYNSPPSFSLSSCLSSIFFFSSLSSFLFSQLQ